MDFADPLGGLDLQALLDTFPHHVMLVDEDRRILMTNLAVTRRVGALPEEVVGLTCAHVVHGVERCAGCPLETAVASGDDVESVCVSAKGERVFTSVYPTGYSSSDGKRIYLHVSRPLEAPRFLS